MQALGCTKPSKVEVKQIFFFNIRIISLLSLINYSFTLTSYYIFDMRSSSQIYTHTDLIKYIYIYILQ